MSLEVAPGLLPSSLPTVLAEVSVEVVAGVFSGPDFVAVASFGAGRGKGFSAVSPLLGTSGDFAVKLPTPVASETTLASVDIVVFLGI